MPHDEKQMKNRLLTLRSAADILQALQSELPFLRVMIEQTRANVQRIATAYAEHVQGVEELASLRESERRPPRRIERVPLRSRSKQVPPLTVTTTDRTTPIAPLDSCHTTRSDDDPDAEYYEANPDQGGPNGGPL